MIEASVEVAYFVKRLYRKVLGSIAFYPILISITFLALGLFVANVGIHKYEFWKEWNLTFLNNIDSEIAQTIISTIIGGIFSLTVFSFSMVMVVLSQASSDFSPRLLPSLISDRNHQLILGFYTGTLLYAFVVLISLGKLAEFKKDLGFATVLAAVFGICCVVLFVVFIHSISQSIQIDNIVRAISAKAQTQLKNVTDNQKQFEQYKGSLEVVYCNSSGYYNHFTNVRIKDQANDLSIRIEIIPYRGKYVWKGEPLFYVTKGISQELKNEINKSIHLSADKDDSDNYLNGMTKLMEVAVKAMSPGINDPGTAIDSITKLGKLMRMAFKINDKSKISLSNNKIEIFQNNISPKALMRLVFQPIVHYGQSDLSVLCTLVECLNSLHLCNDLNNEVNAVITYELKLLKKKIINSGFNESYENHFNDLFKDAF